MSIYSYTYSKYKIKIFFSKLCTQRSWLIPRLNNLTITLKHTLWNASTTRMIVQLNSTKFIYYGHELNLKYFLDTPCLLFIFYLFIYLSSLEIFQLRRGLRFGIVSAQNNVRLRHKMRVIRFCIVCLIQI